MIDSMRAMKCVECGNETYQKNGICVLCETGITQIYRELIDLLKMGKEENLIKKLKRKEADWKMSLDRRADLRYDFPYTAVEYILNPTPNYGTFIGFIDNISDSGVSLKTSKLLSVGQKIVIKSLLFTSSKKAVVRWIRKVDDFFYRVGLKFL
ncbi:MAG: PilZ domain-containing protein [Nitrospirota bacterium]